MMVQVLELYKLRARLLLSEEPIIRTAPSAVIMDPEKTRPGNDLPYRTAFDPKIIIITAAILFLLIAVLAAHALTRWLLRRFRPAASPNASKPMKKRQVSALPTTVFTLHGLSGLQAPQCPICLADFAQGDVIRVLPTCQHVFHARCVDTWLCRQATCPTCRADLLKREERLRSVELHVMITPRGDLCPTLCGGQP